MYAFLPDILLIVVSGFTCLYCIILSRRLKKLQSLDSGLGASILSLTQAVAKTNSAALEARKSTEVSVKMLQGLLLDVENAIPQIEARLESLYGAKKAAETKSALLQEVITKEIEPALQRAQQTSRSLLQIVRAVKTFEERKSSGTIAKQKRAA
ncbi:MAG: hypothetical protein L3J65_00080 [Robiginitomaculum sp.]|nr:hypothetical protein [Robiginitomaculum sp.]